MVEITFDRFGSPYPFGDDPDDLNNPYTSAGPGDAHMHTGRHLM